MIGHGCMIGPPAAAGKGVQIIGRVPIIGGSRKRAASVVPLNGLTVSGTRVYGTMPANGAFVYVDAQLRQGQYIEVLCTTINGVAAIGIGDCGSAIYAYYAYNGRYWNGAAPGASYSSTYSNGAVIGIGYTPDTGGLKFWRNGTALAEKTIPADGSRYPMAHSGTSDSAYFDITFRLTRSEMQYIPNGYLAFDEEA